MNPLRKLLFTVLFFSFIGGVFAQRSKDGAKVVTTANNIVNEYTSLTANAAVGATTITVAASTLNANGRFTGNLAAGDLIMIIQMQGATINGTPSDGVWPNPPVGIGVPTDSTWGSVTNYNNCGNWEFAEVISVPDNVTINVACPFKNSYTSTGKTLVVRVPRYSSLTVNAGGSITCDPWNGTLGGVCAIEVENNSTINGSINTTGDGFRGGQLIDNTTQLQNLFFSASTLNVDGAEKGEGIAGYKTDYTQFGGMYMRGAPGNGGGGANIHNGGGGGGANGGNPSLWNGHGMPDNSVAGYSNAWELQYTGFSTQISSGGGQGGYSFSANNGNPTTQAPGNNAVWGGQGRFPIGGYGGRPLDYSTGRLFLGGGGGSGDQNDLEGGAGANGGGLIYLMNYGTVSGTGQIISNGNNGFNTTGALQFSNHRDGAGGGGGGGTIVINSVGTLTGISLNANGGNGGNQTINQTQAQGPGGGGGGGYIAISNGTPSRTTNGGTNGTTTSNGVNQFPPNGATMGGAGTNTATVTNFIINAANTTICAGQSATLNATISGTAPGGTTITWYDAAVGGSILPSTVGTYTTPILSAGTYTYYVSTCPGTYHQPVLVTANTPSVSVSPNSTICSGASTTLDASGGTAYSWSPATGLNNPNISNPVATPISTTTYVVTVTTSCGPATDSVIVNVNSSFTPVISGNTSICAGENSTLTASGGSTYSWSTGATTTAITVSPTSDATYSVNVSSGSCTGTTSITVNVSNGISASISGNSTICPGSNTTLTASGGTNYSWFTGETTAAITVAPTSNTTYSVIASSGSCSDTIAITVTMSNTIIASINGPATICSSGNATLTASGGNTYSWSTTETTASIIVSPTAPATYSVIVSSGTCTDTATITVNVSNSITASISGNTTICAGESTTFTASGGSTYSWSTGATTSAITVAPTSTTTYSVIASSGSCSDTTSITVTASNNIIAVINGSTNICAGTVATLTASGGATYAWSSGETTASINPAVAGTYSVIITSGTCKDTAASTTIVSPLPIASVSPDITIIQGQSADLSASGGTTYLWNTGSNQPTISVSPLITTIYCATVYNANNCSDTACVSVRIESCSGSEPLYLPNAFSPNGDTENDELQIYYGVPQCIETFHLALYNRWGEKVFETSDPAFKWNGVYNRGLLKEKEQGHTQVYVYYMNAEIMGGTKISRKGNISLLR